MICWIDPWRTLCLAETRSLEALLVLSALGQALLEMKGLFLPLLMSSFRGSSFTKQKLKYLNLVVHWSVLIGYLFPADTILSFEHSGEMCLRGLELVDRNGLDSEVGEVGMELSLIHI